MNYKKAIIILDPGHGGIINGVYQTPGKRSPLWSDGSQLFEGEFNRSIVEKIHQQLIEAGFDSRILVPELTDVSLSERVKRANQIKRDNPGDDCYYISVHANAGGGKGFEVYTYHGQSKSDELAESIAQAFQVEFPDKKMRSDLSDGDSDKESDFYVLRKTSMPAILTENFFMDNEQECREILMTEKGRQKIADFHVEGIKNFLGFVDKKCPNCGCSLN